MDVEKAIMVIGITLAVVIMINLAILVSYRRKGTPNEFHLFGRVIQRARQPWQGEDANLEALHELVQGLKKEPDSAPGGEGIPNSGQQ